MKRVLLDTSVLIDFLRKKDKKKSLLVDLFQSGHLLSISLITHTELFSGRSVWEKKEARKELEELLSGLEVIVFDKKVSELAGKIRARYRINLIDAIIAAETIVSHLPLVTLNTKDFKKIKEIKLFKI